MKTIAILGASGHGKVVAEIAELSGYKKIVFFDDYKDIGGFESWEIQGNTKNLISKLSSFESCNVAIGDNKVRMEKIKLLQSNNAKIISLIHPQASVSKYSIIQKGTVIMANAVVNPYATVGMSCIVNTNSTIEHDCLIGDGVHISPNVALAGSVSIGNETWIGIGSSVKQNIEIGSNVKVGAGSLVINNLPDDVVAFGVPAKIKL
jgi:sugar O-acyltransferase (sialic acid O-acetyltransferase NeuD family)